MELIKNINVPYDEDFITKLKLLNEHKFDKLPQNFTLKPTEILAEQIFHDFQELYEVKLSLEKF